MAVKVVTAGEMRGIERRAEDVGVSTVALMEHAGRAVAEEALRCLGEAAGKRVLVLVGPGNNGGDGLVAAHHLWDAGARVVVYIWSREAVRDGHLETVRQKAVPVLQAADDQGLAALRARLAEADLVVDALLGTGRTRPATGLLKEILQTVDKGRRRDSLLLAVDLPTGLDANTGAVDASALRADVTITLGFPKVGLFAFPGAEYVGRLAIGDIGLPANVAGDVAVELITAEEVACLLPARPLSAHKGTFGKVMVVGGCPKYIGAPALACVAAARSGAGLVTLSCAATLQPTFGAKLTESTFAPLPDAAPGVLGAGAVEPLRRELDGYDVLLVGPGLGRAEETEGFVRALLPAVRDTAPTTGHGGGGTALSCVVDADALNALAGLSKWWTALPERTILTPHSGEMARLLRVDIEAVNADRPAAARDAAGRWGAVVVLKGPFTIVAAPDGRIKINPSANPALATAGTGDVLAGTIAGLLAQGLEPFAAATAGVYLHGQAGELARAVLGDAGVLAGDLLPLLPQAIRELKRHSG